MIPCMKNRKSQFQNIVMSVSGLMLASATQVMAQVRNPDPGLPKLGDESLPSSGLYWGLAGLFTVLVLLVAFRNSKRIIGNRD